MNKADNYEIQDEVLHQVLLNDFMSAYSYGLPQHFAARAEIARLRDALLEKDDKIKELEQKSSVKPAKGSTAKAGKSDMVTGE